MEDNAIIGLFFARDEAAIQEVDCKYGPLCRRLSYNILNNEQDAEECVSDSYLGLWNTIPPQRPNPLLTFLCKIVRNRSVARYHANTASKRNGAYDAALSEIEPCLAAPDDPQAQLEVKELTRLLEQFLDGLSRENRVIFLRRYWFSDSYADIAKQVGLTEKNVSVRLTRIRAQLLTHLIRNEVFV